MFVSARDFWKPVWSLARHKVKVQVVNGTERADAVVATHPVAFQLPDQVHGLSQQADVVNKLGQ